MTGAGQTIHPATRQVGGFELLPVSTPRVRRILQLLVGLVLFGVALALAVEAALGVNAWSVFSQGVSDLTGLSFGTIVVLTGVALVAILRLFREPLGLGTLLNALIIGPVADFSIWAIPDTDAMVPRLAMIIAAPIVLGLASGLYLGAGLGPGPRDGCMTALNRAGAPLWAARTIVELLALLVGWLLGGDVGLGTVWMATSVGWWVQLFVPRFRIDTHVT